MNMKRYILIPVALTLLLGGCTRFLDVAPDDRTVLDTPDAIRKLLVTAYPDMTYIPFYEMRSDNVTKVYDYYLGGLSGRQIYCFQGDIESTGQDYPLAYWRACYWATASANQALEALDELGKLSREGKRQADLARGEALMCRAYNGYMLAETFCRPYAPDSLTTYKGIPYPTSTESEVIKKYTRGTLGETYDMILKDFREGFELIGSDYEQPKFHFTKESAAAFGCRLARTMGDWDKVLSYGKMVMGDNPMAKIRDYRKFQQMTGNECRKYWSYPTEACNLMITSPYSNYANSLWGSSFQLSADLYGDSISMKYSFLGKGVRTGLKTVQYYKYLHTPKFPYNSVFVVFTGEEVLFNMAEAYIMKNQYAEALALLQLFVQRWFTGYAPGKELYQVTAEKIRSYYAEDTHELKPFYTVSPEQALYLKALLALKRHCFLQEGMRWMDIRHFNLPVYHRYTYYDSEYKKELYVLEPGDPRYAFQIPPTVRQWDIEGNFGYDNIKPLVEINDDKDKK